MFVIIREDDKGGYEPISTATDIRTARIAIADHFGCEFDEVKLEVESDHKYVFCFGDEQYVVYPTTHWS